MKSMLNPGRFLVVVPFRNCEDYIAECLDSLQAQTFTQWEALLADDASTDNSVGKIQPYLEDSRIALRTLDERAWLMGNTLDALWSLDIQPGDVVAILDGDDYLYPECLEKIWNEHCAGYDLVYTDEVIEGQDYSIGKHLIPGVSPRNQLWSFSQLRSFKGYLFSLLEKDCFRDANGQFFKAAGDLSLYLPMAELCGHDKCRLIEEKLYYYRIHENCNFKVNREEQLDNNKLIRSRNARDLQTEFFDYVEEVDFIDKGSLVEFGHSVRKEYPLPYSVCVRHKISAEKVDSWRAYHGLWIERGVYLKGVVNE